jgi:23S rRNA (adenine2503-C2)-methyltransferase
MFHCVTNTCSVCGMPIARDCETCIKCGGRKLGSTKLEIIEKKQSSISNAIKYVMCLDDGASAEISLINKDGKLRICVPSQVGCKMGCKFCYMTTHQQFAKHRNLASYEIIDMILYVINDNKINDKLLISFMSNGEPLVNLSQVHDVFHELFKLDNRMIFAMATSMPRVGFRNFMDSLAYGSWHGCKMHLSLHFTNDDQRRLYMPNSMNIKTSVCLLELYRELTNNDIEIHYSLINGINDTNAHAKELSEIVLGRDILIKLLRFNKNGNMEPSTDENVKIFSYNLATYGVQHELYTSPGSDIGAGCGQFTEIKP